MKISFVEDIFAGMGDDGKNPSLPAGSATWSLDADKQPANLLFICPCGCHAVRSVPVTGKHKWNWDGNRELPTLTPSILVVDECRWHGFLTGGAWITV